MKVARHRLAQGLRALLAFARAPDLALARRYLSPCELAAFMRMSQADQLHSLNVLRLVLGADPLAPAVLAAAALLHDVGKSRCHLAVWQKTLTVILGRLSPGLGRELGAKESLNRWRAPFVVSRRHPRWSGEILRECGSDAAVIWLAENHHEGAEHFRDHSYFVLLLALQAADSSS